MCLHLALAHEKDVHHQVGVRRPRGETPLLGVQLNAHIALGAKIAVLRVRFGLLFIEFC